MLILGGVIVLAALCANKEAAGIVSAIGVGILGAALWVLLPYAYQLIIYTGVGISSIDWNWEMLFWPGVLMLWFFVWMWKSRNHPDWRWNRKRA